MKTLKYQIEINASQKDVWNTMLDAGAYQKWVKAFSSNAVYEGQWKQGTHINFVDPACGGTKAFLDEVRPFERIHAKHIAVISEEGQEDTSSEVAQTWIGTTETYEFQELNNATQLTVTMHTHENFEKMFNEAWPQALKILKGLAESPA